MLFFCSFVLLLWLAGLAVCMLSVRRCPWLAWLCGAGLLGFAVAAAIYGLATFSPEGSVDFNVTTHPYQLPMLVAFYAVIGLSCLAVSSGITITLAQACGRPKAVQSTADRPALPDAECFRLWNERTGRLGPNIQPGNEAPSDFTS
jgi:hypothetical protein